MLYGIADRLRRLPAYSCRNPHAWHEGRDELAAEIAALAADLPPGRIAVDPKVIGAFHTPRRRS